METPRVPSGVPKPSRDPQERACHGTAKFTSPGSQGGPSPPMQNERVFVSPVLGEGLREQGSFSIGCHREGGQFSDGDLLSLTCEVGSSTGMKLKWGKKQLSL